MVRFINIATAEILTALVIWALIEGFGRVAKNKGKLRSFGIFLAIWALVIAFHAIVLTPPERLTSAASPGPIATADAGVSENDTATFVANKPQLQAIVRDVLSGRVVDQKTHDLYWSLIPASMVSTPEHRQEVMSGFSQGMHFQREFWESLLLSAHAHQIVKTQAFEEALRQSDPTAVAKSSAMLQAAASGSPYTLSNGQGTLTVDEAYAKQVLSNLDASAARLKVLSDPVWHP